MGERYRHVWRDPRKDLTDALFVRRIGKRVDQTDRDRLYALRQQRLRDVEVPARRGGDQGSLPGLPSAVLGIDVRALRKERLYDTEISRIGRREQRCRAVVCRRIGVGARRE